MCERIGLPKLVVDSAKQIFKQVDDEKMLRGKYVVVVGFFCCFFFLKGLVLSKTLFCFKNLQFQIC